jgi:hypothetical protein
MNFPNILNLFYFVSKNIGSSGLIYNACNNAVFSRHPYIKIILLIIFINLIYRTFVYLIFILIKSIFPIIYMYFLLNLMDKSSEEKPISNLLFKINDNNNKENIIETLENQMNKQLGIVNYTDHNIDQV